MKRIILAVFMITVLLLFSACTPVRVESRSESESPTETERKTESESPTETETKTESETRTEEETEPMEDEVVWPRAQLVLEANGKIYYPVLEDNSSSEAFFKKLEAGELKLALHDYGHFEKVGPLPWDLPRNDEEITTVPGDIILYQGNQLTIYYDQNTWEFTRLARISGVSREELLEVLGDGDVTVSFWLEWDE